MLAGALALGAAVPTSASAVPAVNGEFSVSDQPKRLAQGPDGNIWVTIGGKIARITPAGVVTEFDPANIDFPTGITAGPDGNMWVTQSVEVAKFSPANPNGAESFSILDLNQPQSITTGPDGNLWTASGDKVIEIPPANPTAYQAHPVSGLGARGIARGGDGNLWVADFASGVIHSVTTAGVATPYPVDGGPQEVAAGPGTQVAYTNPGADPHQVGRISPGGTAQKTNVPLTDPFGITLGADGAYWFTQFTTDRLGRLTTDGQLTTLSGLSANSGPRYITAGPGNTLWVALQTSNKVARITGVDPPAPSGTGQPSGGGGGVATISVSGVSVRPNRFAVGSAPTPVAAQRVPRGTRIRYTVSAAGTVRLTIERALAGRQRGRRCVRPTPRLRRARRCTRYRRAGTLRRNGTAGRNTVRFSGRIGRRALRRGRYRLTVRATTATGVASLPRRTTFRVVRVRRR